MLYLLEQRSFEEDDIEKIASNMSATARGKIMTAYEKMAKREQKIGMEAGIKTGKEEMARTFLKQGVALEIVAKASGMFIEDLKKL